MQSQHGSIASFNWADFVYKLIWLEEGSKKGHLSEMTHSVYLRWVCVCVSEVNEQDEWIMFNRRRDTCRTTCASQTPSCFMFQTTELRNMVMPSDNSCFPQDVKPFSVIQSHLESHKTSPDLTAEAVLVFTAKGTNVLLFKA